MKSMTGYGKGVASLDGREVTVELKAVNNRYLEINSRLPKALSSCDDAVRRAVNEGLKRGAVDVYFNYENRGCAEKTVTVDDNVVDAYLKAAARLKEIGIENDLTAAAIMRFPETVRIDTVKDSPEIIAALTYEAAKQAVEQLDAMRFTEGQTIKEDLQRLSANIAFDLKEASNRAPQVVEEYRFRLKARIVEYLEGIEVDQARLLNEVAFFADKADINEEISRLSSHLKQFDACLDSDEPQGRRLDFIAQEMNREINTMGSKSNDMVLTSYVIAMKNELEKVREQIRNVE